MDYDILQRFLFVIFIISTCLPWEQIYQHEGKTIAFKHGGVSPFVTLLGSYGSYFEGQNGDIFACILRGNQALKNMLLGWNSHFLILCV